MFFWEHAFEAILVPPWSKKGRSRGLPTPIRHAQACTDPLFPLLGPGPVRGASRRVPALPLGVILVPFGAIVGHFGLIVRPFLH